MRDADSYSYNPDPEWFEGTRPDYGGVICGMAVDSANRVVLCRRDPPALVLCDTNGTIIDLWGTEVLEEPHSVSCGPRGLWVTDTSDHTVRCFDGTGAVVQVLGNPGRPGYDGRPFNKPTKAVEAFDGRVYVADGYGQQRIHCFSSDGALLFSWGSEGCGPGEFALPHSLSVAETIFVADRQNSRICEFTSDGEYIGEFSAREWPGIAWPNDVIEDGSGALFVAEASHRVSILRRGDSGSRSPIRASAAPFSLVGRFGELGPDPGQFLDCPHALAIDADANLYVSEVPFHSNRVQKFTRRS